MNKTVFLPLVEERRDQNPRRQDGGKKEKQTRYEVNSENYSY